MTQNITTTINKPYEGIQTYQQLLDIVEKAQPDISFWGWRYITAEGYQGRGSLEDLAEKVGNLSETHLTISKDERVVGKKIGAFIIQLYNESDRKLEQKFFLTRILCYLRDVHFDIFACDDSVPEKWSAYTCYFCNYTKAQWEEKFGQSPTSNPDALNPDRWFSYE